MLWPVSRPSHTAGPKVSHRTGDLRSHSRRGQETRAEPKNDECCGRSPDRVTRPDRRSPIEPETCGHTRDGVRRPAPNRRMTNVVAGLPTESHGRTEGLPSNRRPAVTPATGSGDPRRTEE